MIFLDTSAIYAWADTADPNHAPAVRRLQAILDARSELFTHDYVLVESLALLQARLGLAAATRLAKDSETLVIEWVEQDLHHAGIRELERSRKRHVSLLRSQKLRIRRTPEGFIVCQLPRGVVVRLVLPRRS